MIEMGWVAIVKKFYETKWIDQILTINLVSSSLITQNMILCCVLSKKKTLQQYVTYVSVMCQLCAAVAIVVMVWF